MWEIAGLTDDVIDMARQLGCTWIGHLHNTPHAAYDHNQCHNNVLTHVSIYGGQQQLGYYFLKGFGTIQAVRHSVWSVDNSFVDITPYEDSREYIMFGCTNSQDYSIRNCFSHSLAKYIEQEVDIMYYVYQLVDPRTNTPFYIGKGTGNRAKSHLKDTPDTRNVYKENKIAAIRHAGLEPVIEYVAENIIDEQLAYTIESTLIKQYGRKGYDEVGILTNICSDNRPPNHKGKTYEDIYGETRAVEQRALRSELQKARGGYGPAKHSDETKMKLSKARKGANNARFGVKVAGTSTAMKISKANKGKKHYDRPDVKLLFIEGLSKFIYSNDLGDFCIAYGYSHGTFSKQLRENWPTSKKGKNKGLRIRYATEVELSSYVIGGVKQDVTQDTLDGLSL